jgi:hypothetical protein
MLATEPATIPVWAMALQNRGATRTKYEHLIASLRRRIASAIDTGNQSLIRDLRQELVELEREI